MTNPEQQSIRAERQRELAVDFIGQLHIGNISDFVKELNDRKSDPMKYHDFIEAVNTGFKNGTATTSEYLLAQAHNAKVSASAFPKIQIVGLTADGKNLVVEDACVRAELSQNATVLNTRSIESIASEEAMGVDKPLRPVDLTGFVMNPMRLPGADAGNSLTRKTISTKQPDGSVINKTLGTIDYSILSTPSNDLEMLKLFLPFTDKEFHRNSSFEETEKIGADGRLLERHIKYLPNEGWRNSREKQMNFKPHDVYPQLEISDPTKIDPSSTIKADVRTVDSVYDSRTHLYKTTINKDIYATSIYQDNRGHVVFDAGRQSKYEQNKCAVYSGALKPGQRADINEVGTFSQYAPLPMPGVEWPKLKMFDK